MSKEWHIFSETRDLAEKLTKKFPVFFSHVNVDEISCVVCMGGKPPNGGRTLARISVISDKIKIATGTPYNFILEVYDGNWYDLDSKQKQMVIFHELMHIDPEDAESPKLRKHDLEDFHEILSIWGIDYLDNTDIPKLLDENLNEEDYGLEN